MPFFLLFMVGLFCGNLLFFSRGKTFSVSVFFDFHRLKFLILTIKREQKTNWNFIIKYFRYFLLFAIAIYMKST